MLAKIFRLGLTLQTFITSRPGLDSIITSEVISILPGVAKMQLAPQSSVTDPEVGNRSLLCKLTPVLCKIKSGSCCSSEQQVRTSLWKMN